MTKIAVIISTTREGRLSDKLVTWVAEEARKVAEVEVIDLRDYPLPFFDEPISPRYNPNRTPIPEAQQWLDKLAEFDGYAIVTAEYNRTMPGVLKNAIDYVAFEMDKKPVALIGHGSSGGAQAVATLRIALPGVGAFAIPTALFFTDKIGEAFDEDGILKAELRDGPYSKQASLEGLTQELAWYAEALATAR